MAAHRHFVLLQWESVLFERLEEMSTIQRTLAMSGLIFATALLLGCASSAPSTSQAPPETPELKPPASEAPTDEGGRGQGGGRGSGPGSGDGSSESAGQTAGGAGEAPSGEASTSAGDGASGDAGGETPGGGIPEGVTATGDEAAAALDRELSGAIEQFERHMREEMQRLAEEAEGSERARSSSPGGAGGESTPGGEADPRSGPGEGAEKGGDSAGSVGGSGPDAGVSNRVPADVGDGSDDDIVARQLREAAMAEEDPELREKLWDEYRRYKASVGGAEKGNQ